MAVPYGRFDRVCGASTSCAELRLLRQLPAHHSRPALPTMSGPLPGELMLHDTHRSMRACMNLEVPVRLQVLKSAVRHHAHAGPVNCR